ncbi:hypothetical protein ASAP_3080 [Asaia bogorensis]|uniref:Uncharacterized protein n=1 Tax=Asaia bogorensis TaxID=91915 RepID=A0A060QJK8_9PROT|nr:hypothetical protein ASAP_3080 [Asaia bogorensis]
MRLHPTLEWFGNRVARMRHQGNAERAVHDDDPSLSRDGDRVHRVGA